MGIAKRVCVIGAGPSGIAAAKNCIHAGLDVVVFEKNDRVGDNWVFDAGAAMAPGWFDTPTPRDNSTPRRSAT